MFNKLSEDLVAPAVFEAGYGGHETHWNKLMVFHSHLNLWPVNSGDKNQIRVLNSAAELTSNEHCLLTPSPQLLDMRDTSEIVANNTKHTGLFSCKNTITIVLIQMNCVTMQPSKEPLSTWFV